MKPARELSTSDGPNTEVASAAKPTFMRPCWYQGDASGGKAA
jgi:hypothetical protein